MIDWHSHILPEMDDGSRSVDESKALLLALARQGVTTVMATPHFYADEESVDSFLQRRRQAFDKLQGLEGPLIRCGAELAYYPGIYHLPGLSGLCLEGTDILLLEMPQAVWTEFTLREVMQLSAEYTLVLAHAERYIFLQKRGTLQRLLQRGVLLQTNASFILQLRTRQKALRLLKNGSLQLLGSDCHNMQSRPPRIGEAGQMISKKLGGDFLDRLSSFGYALLHM